MSSTSAPGHPSGQRLVDTVIIGNGPSALILSYILHGNIPQYVGEHKDQILHRQIATLPHLLRLNQESQEYIRNSPKYDSQALPFNALVDEILRPDGDVNSSSLSHVQWMQKPEKAVSHIVLGNTDRSGGQWADNLISASPDIGALSYAEMLSLPGYSMSQHWKVSKGEQLPEMIRPTRRDAADYFAAYPDEVGISGVLEAKTVVSDISRTPQGGFHIGSHNIHCKHLVLASGVFTINLPPPTFLSDLSRIAPPLNTATAPVLVIGSGFTAADLIISTPPDRKIIHIFNWDPENHPSPLRACHASAYPEYAGVYRQMREWAQPTKKSKSKISKMQEETQSTLPFFAERNWEKTYEGLPNARVLNMPHLPDANPPPSALAHSQQQTAELYGRSPSLSAPRRRSIFSMSHSRSDKDNRAAEQRVATIQIAHHAFTGAIMRTIGTFHYATGRRGSLAYLDDNLLHEVLPEHGGDMYHLDPSSPSSSTLTAHTVRQRSFSDSKTPTLSTLKDESAEHYQPPLVLEPPDRPARASSISHDWATDEPGGSEEVLVSARTLRGKIENRGVEVAPSVFAVGSLTGDSLVRFAYGGCFLAAGKIMGF